MAVENQKLKNTLDTIEKELAQLPPRIPRFIAYDPYMTFGTGANAFISFRGSKSLMDDDKKELFDLGAEIYEVYCDGISREDFILAVEEYGVRIKNLLEIFCGHEASGALILKNRNDYPDFDWDGLDDSQILDIAWQYLCTGHPAFEGYEDLFRKLYLMRALIGIDDILVSKDIGAPITRQLIEVVNSFNNSFVLGSSSADLKKARSKQAYDAALSRLKKDPKQKAKLDIKNEWLALTAGQKKYGYKAKFARDMQTKYPVIEDEKTITGWVTEWEKL